jgi:putative sterol carrier protein
VIAWRITGRRDGHADVRELVIEDGAAYVLAGEARPADLELTLDGTDFIEMATGHQRAVRLFLRGRLEVEGDPWLAMRLERVLRVPRAG